MLATSAQGAGAFALPTMLLAGLSLSHCVSGEAACLGASLSSMHVSHPVHDDMAHTFDKPVMRKMWCRDMLEELMDDEDEMRDMNLSSRPGREEKRRVRERDRLEREMERQVCTVHSSIAFAFAVLHRQACLLHCALKKVVYYIMRCMLYKEMYTESMAMRKCWAEGVKRGCSCIAVRLTSCCR